MMITRRCARSDLLDAVRKSLFKITDHLAARSSGNFVRDVLHIAPQVIDACRIISAYIFLAISPKENIQWV